MLRNLVKAEYLRTHNKLVPSHGTLHLKYRLLFSGRTQQTQQTQQAYLFISNGSKSLHKYPINFRNISRKFSETVNIEKATTKPSNFRRKIFIASSLTIC